MTKERTVILSACALAGAAAGVWTGRKTDRIRREARRQGAHVPYGPYEAVIKRPLDVTAGMAACALLAPVMAVCALLVKIKLGSPVIFTQQRPGLNGQMFCIHKFRTMTDRCDSSGRLLPDGDRLTDFGKWLRSSSLDELPELTDIIRGNMSFAGPRPLLAEYLPRYNERQKHRHDVRPGLTGLAQVSGRNGLSWEEKFEKDLEYVEKITFLTDLKILYETVKAVFKKEGINSPASATAELFTGGEDR